MTQPASRPSAPSAFAPACVDAALRAATEARPDAPVAGSRVPRDGSSVAGGVHRVAEGTHAVIDTGTLVIEIGGVQLGQGTLGAAVAAAETASPLLLEVGLIAGIARELEGADAANRQLHTERMEGALAALEGRADDTDVRRRAERNPAYAEGIRAAESFARLHPTEFARAVEMVRASRNAGIAAVALGRDRTPAAQQRYASDPAFRHAVDYMRRLDRSPAQGGDPTGFAREVGAVRARLRDVERARLSGGIAP